MKNKTVLTFEHHGASNELVVLLHAYRKTPDSLRDIREVILGTHSDADIFMPCLPTSTLSFVSPIAIVCGLLEEIDQKWTARQEKHGKPYDRIIIVGHSLGALLARKLYVYACGETTNAPFENEAASGKRREWASYVDRIILIAGMNRGWTISHHMSIVKAFKFRLGVIIGEFLHRVRKGKPLIFHARRGAPFLTNLRIQWLAMRSASLGKALTIQLLGSVDDLVSPEDNIDLVSGADFAYLDVRKSDHENIIDMNDSQEGRERKRIFLFAYTASTKEIKDHSVLPQDTELPSKRLDVTDVIFVIHGIRDLGHWTDKIARRVQKLGEANHRVFVTETSSYGYFPALSFIFPWRRRAKVEWLMDQYAEALARYPNASFSYLGHSHGTYLLAKALMEYPCCRFKHVAFAGSVVRSDYKWDVFLKSGRLKAVLNYIATGDFVVAVFPYTFQKLNWQDLGGAGHSGFDSCVPSQIKYIKGGHSAALNEDNWDAIASFIVNGMPVSPPDEIKATQQTSWVTILGHVAPVLLSAIVALAIFIIYFLLPDLSADQWKGTFILSVYLFSIYFLATKF